LYFTKEPADKDELQAESPEGNIPGVAVKQSHVD
jgi:hypothetical protein